jgi:hypothetical protein
MDRSMTRHKLFIAPDALVLSSNHEKLFSSSNIHLSDDDDDVMEISSSSWLTHPPRMELTITSTNNFYFFISFSKILRSGCRLLLPFNEQQQQQQPYGTSSLHLVGTIQELMRALSQIEVDTSLLSAPSGFIHWTLSDNGNFGSSWAHEGDTEGEGEGRRVW